MSAATRDSAIADALAERDATLAERWVDDALCEALFERARALAQCGALRPARVGRGAGARELPTVRGDAIGWLGHEDAVEAALLARLDALRLVLNRRLFLGLTECEAHFAHYAPGARYARHLDCFRDDARRTVSVVLYLNRDWRDADGGALRLYGQGSDGAALDLLPVAGRAVVFLSARVEHEVLPARRGRFSVAAWLRRA